MLVDRLSPPRHDVRARPSHPQVVRDELQDGRSHGVGLLVGRNCDRQGAGARVRRQAGWPCRRDCALLHVTTVAHSPGCPGCMLPTRDQQSTPSVRTLPTHRLVAQCSRCGLMRALQGRRRTAA